MRFLACRWFSENVVRAFRVAIKTGRTKVGPLGWTPFDFTPHAQIRSVHTTASIGGGLCAKHPLSGIPKGLQYPHRAACDICKPLGIFPSLCQLRPGKQTISISLQYLHRSINSPTKPITLSYCRVSLSNGFIQTINSLEAKEKKNKILNYSSSAVWELHSVCPKWG